MDLDDDFQMKPLTEGLGFHEKAIKLKDGSKKIGQSSLERDIPSAPPDMFFQEDQSAIKKQSIETDPKKAIDDLIKALDAPGNLIQEKPKSDLRITETLPRHPRSQGHSRKAEVTQRTAQLDIPTESMPNFVPDTEPQSDFPLRRPLPPKRQQHKIKPNIASDLVRRGAADSPVNERWVPAAVSLSSAILDGVVVLALSMLFLVSLLIATDANLSSVVGNISHDITTQTAMGVLYLAVLFMYVVVARSFFGKTLGEWTFDLQMGESAQLTTSIYPILVAWRSIVVLATGLFTLPFLSLILRKDVASYFTGLQLYRREN